MNAEDLETLRTLTTRTRDLVNQLCVLADFGSTDAHAADDLRLALRNMRDDCARLTRVVQDREARSWSREDHAPRVPMPPRLSRSLPVSSDVRGVGVTKCPPGIAGGAVDPT